MCNTKWRPIFRRSRNGFGGFILQFSQPTRKIRLASKKILFNDTLKNVLATVLVCPAKMTFSMIFFAISALTIRTDYFTYHISVFMITEHGLAATFCFFFQLSLVLIKKYPDSGYFSTACTIRVYNDHSKSKQFFR